MKKYLVVMLLAVVLMCAMASCSFASLLLRFDAQASQCKVGNKTSAPSSFLATMLLTGGSNSYSFSIVGSLPPGCSLYHASCSPVAYIHGTPTTAGTYTFTVRASAQVYSINYYTGSNGFPIPVGGYTTQSTSTLATMTITGSSSTGTTNTRTNTGNNTSSDTNTGSTGNNANVSGGGGGGCDSSFGVIALTALAILRHRH